MACHFVGEPGELLGLQRDRDPGPLGRLLGQALEGGFQAKLVEHAGPKLARNAADDLHRFVDPVGERNLAKAEGAGISPRLPGLDPGDVQLQGSERLSQLVVNLPRDPGPFFLTRRLQPGREGPQLGP